MLRLEVLRTAKSTEVAGLNKNPAKKTMEEVVSEIVAAMKEFHDQADRVVAIVGAAYLDSALDELLRAVLIESRDEVDKLLGHYGVLGANGARCQLAYCLGLITGDQCADMKTIARIRNKFAHDFSITAFDAPPVSDYCALLKSPSRRAAMPSQLFPAAVASQVTEFLTKKSEKPREQFRASVSVLLVSLLRRIHFVRREGHQWFSHDPDALTGPSTTT
jgi:DNA-binding MltR family transcriptional regulator